MNFYNEIDDYCCDWLENLIRERLIPDGVVDRRSIVDILPVDLNGFTQCHFFAGLGGWPLALRRAAYPDHKPVWTGSCPCQPFSSAGKRLGFADDRHLWPYWRYLIAVRRPSIVLGEQIEKAGDWLDLVLTDMETLGYACGAANYPSASQGARHIRQRLWYVAHADEAGWSHIEGMSTAETGSDFRTSPGLVSCDETWDLQRSTEPNESWIVDGLSGEGLAVSALGNAIDPRPAAAFIRAALDY